MAAPCIGGIVMLHKIVQLTDDAKLYVYVPTIRMNPKPRDGLLVIPGGGYGFVSMDREGEPIALKFCGKGLSCFVLEYSTREKAKFPTPLKEAALAMAHIKEHAQQYDVDPERIFAVGFSAGGHLTGSLGSFWHREDITGVPGELARPKGTILVYPVITTGPYTHAGTTRNLCGTDTPTQQQKDAWSLEKQVSEYTVPVFLMHTAADDCVPVENTLMYAAALSEKKIPMEVHITPRGAHGLALADAGTAVNEAGILPEFACWPEMAYDWMQRV